MLRTLAPALLSPRPWQCLQVHPQERHSPPGLILTPRGAACSGHSPASCLTLCWVRSVTAPTGTCRVPALHPQLAVGPALAPEPSSLPFPQDAGCRKAPLEPARGRDLQLASLHCRKTWRGGRDPPAKSPGDPLEAGGICPATLHPGCSSPTAPQRAPRIPVPVWRQQEGRGQS